ncbi:T9SS type A sorting domain-containing protein [Algoriella sp.]|uniref:T9SS type A sorting domain-containing protein n=1 Tax=Algoriella sp. TaxID=1872434 RepID=UPI001B2AEF16|nr:T9SS type A sorting domain-containing protein [Algoriella sp.]MBO6212236.1 T9SS type A sorting domain-containing protein [Algoriella sp.]
MKLKLFLLSTIFIVGVNQVFAQYIRNPESITIGTMSPTGVSNSGEIALYKAQSSPYFIWNPEKNITTEIGGTSPGLGNGGLATFSNDGKFISGVSVNAVTSKFEAARYDVVANKWTTLGSFDYSLDNTAGSAYNISGDGNTLVGLSYYPGGGSTHGFAWNTTKGVIDLGSLHAGRNTRANEVNADGSVIVGWQDQVGNWKSAVWKKNADGGYFPNQYLLINSSGSATDPNNQLGEADAVSGDGKWIGGRGDFAMMNAWLWNQEAGMIDLGRVDEDSRTKGDVTSINHDGSIAIGYYSTFRGQGQPTLYQAFIWTKKDGRMDLNDFLKNKLKFDLGGDIIYVPNQISQNGKYITGWGRSAENKSITFRIQLPDNFLATDEVKSTTEVTLYPNPVNNILNIDAKEQITSISVYNLTGQQIFTKTMNTKTSTVDMSAYKAGVYIVEVNSNANTKAYKVIKK